MYLQRSLEDVQISVTSDPSELLLGLQHAHRHPAQDHPTVPPALDVAGDAPADRVHRLDGVGRLEGANEDLAGARAASPSASPPGLREGWPRRQVRAFEL